MPGKRRKSPSISVGDAGRRLTQIRRARNVTQVQLAEHLGISQGNVSLYERGVVRIPTDLLVKLAEFLRVTSDELLGLKPQPKPIAMKDRRFLRRLELIDRLPKNDRDAILRFINACIGQTRSGQDRTPRQTQS